MIKKMDKLMDKFKVLLKFIYTFTLPILILILIIIPFISESSFNEKIFREENVYNHIKELSSPKYQGRLPGTKGNNMALKYVEEYFRKTGVEPGGDNDTYYQELYSIVPIYKSKPYFRVIDNQGRVIKEYNIREDYIELINGPGGGGNVKGELIHITHHIEKYKPEEINGKILVMDYASRTRELEKAAELGAKAVIFTNGYKYVNYIPLRKIKPSFWSYSKNGKNIIIHIFDRPRYVELIELAERGYKAEINFEVSFRPVKTPNILGKIEGKNKDRILIISGHIDHCGQDLNGKYFPGAFDDASGIGMVLELARVIKAQDIKPNRTIVFACWNNEENGITGATYYTNNPIYPLSKTEVIEIDGIGLKGINKIIFDSAGEKGLVLRNKLHQYAVDIKEKLGLKLELNELGVGSDHMPFIEKGVAAVLIQDAYEERRDQHGVHTYDDNIDNISKEQIRKGSYILLNYFKSEIFDDITPDYFNTIEKLILTILFIGVFFIYLLNILKKINPNIRIFNITIGDIYFSTFYTFINKGFSYIIPVLSILFLIVFISNIPIDFNLIIEDSNIQTNFSFYLILKNSFLYFRRLLTEGFGRTIRGILVVDVIKDSLSKSTILLITTITFAFFVGIFNGLVTGYRKTIKLQRGGLGSIIALSMPDVLIVLIIQIIIIFISKENSSILERKFIRDYIVPVISLSIIPIIYISRISSLIIVEELGKEYVKNSIALGMSRVIVLKKQLLKIVIIRIIDSLPTLVTIMFSNLIIIEYLFYYPGVAYMLLKAYNENDLSSFIGLALSLTLLYSIFYITFKGLSYFLNPFKKTKIKVIP